MHASSAFQNQLLTYLPRKQYNDLVEDCSVVKLTYGQCLHEAGVDIRRVYFPLTGFVGLHVAHEGGRPVDITLIGNEGVLGASILLGVRRAPFTFVVQGAGLALSMSSITLLRQVKLHKEFRRLIKRYLYIQMRQLTLSAICLSHHKVRARLARWLLMGHDRSNTECLALTHAALALMLGVRRSAVTLAARQLQSENMIRYRRGQIEILSHSGLKALCCNCYQAELDSYSALLPSKNN